MNREVTIQERRELIESVKALLMCLNREEVSEIAVVLNRCCERLLKETGEE